MASRASFDPELALRWRADARAELLAEIDELMGAAESRLRTARFAEALVGSREVRERLSEMRRADDLPPTLKTMLVGAELMRRRWGWRYYAKAMNQVRRIRAAYDELVQREARPALEEEAPEEEG